MTRIGVFGGTFDPPHIGHLILAAEAYTQLDLDQVLWVLTPDPPHKLGRVVSPVDSRLALVQAAIADDERFVLSRIEIDRPGPHYSVDTMLLLREDYPAAEFYFLIGGDSLHDLPLWYNPTGLLAACDGLGVMRRVNDQINLDLIEQHLPGIKSKIHFIETPIIEISSSDIRRRVAAGSAFRYYLCPTVYTEILKRKLYSAAVETS